MKNFNGLKNGDVIYSSKYHTELTVEKNAYCTLLIDECHQNYGVYFPENLNPADWELVY